MAVKTKTPAKGRAATNGKTKGPAVTPATNGTNGAAAIAVERKDVPIDRIEPSPFQQRGPLAKAEIEKLAEDIRQRGLLQPIIVRPKPGYRSNLGTADWELIAGECRWRACQSLGHTTIRVEVRAVDDAAARGVLAAENLQRKDLNAIEEAKTYQQAIDAGDAAGPTEVGQLYGVSQGQVSNRLGLLRLPSGIQAKIISREILPTHARHLVPFRDHPKLIAAILKVAEQWRKDGGDGEPLSVTEFRHAIESATWRATERLDRPHYSNKLRRTLPAPKLSDEEREALGIVTIDGPDGKPVELVTNLKELKKVRAAQEKAAVDSAEKREAKGKKPASKAKGKPKELSAAERKRLDEETRERAKQQAAQFRRRLWGWYVDWLRWLIARELRGTSDGNVVLAVLLLRGAKWDDHRVDTLRVLQDAAKAAKDPLGGDTVKHLVAKAGDDKVFGISRKFAAYMFHAHTPSRMVPDDDVGTIAAYLRINIVDAWEKEQAGPAYSEAYWQLHTIDQLKKLATELKVKVDGSKKADYVETFLSRMPATDTGQPRAPAFPKELKSIKRPKGW